MNESITCTVAYCECGCGGLVFAGVNRPETRKDIAKAAAKLIRAGCTVGTMAVEDVRRATWSCEKDRGTR